MIHTEYSAYKLLKLWKGSRCFDFSLEKLFGDASGRIYYRIKNKDFSVVMMIVNETKAPEFGRGDSFKDFIVMHGTLSSVNLPVPAILAVIDDEKMLLLEDLGDKTLYALYEADKKQKFALTKEALMLLIEWQEKIYNRNNFSSTGDKRSFTRSLFMDEFYHFYEYMVEKRVYHPSFHGLWKKAKKKFSAISKELSASPAILSHRDFQSKNIMKKDGRLYIIDFQDALTAPLVYDLVALLRDSYISLSGEELATLLDIYYSESSIARELLPAKEHFLRLFYLQTLQRKMKDAGRFIFLHQVKGKEWFLPFVRPTLFYVKDALTKLEMDDISTMFAPFIEEFRD